MDESNYYFMNRSHIPAFGSWDCNNNDFPIPFTQCFESARQAGLLRYSYSDDRDLYVAGDLYQNDILTPAMIVVPRRKRKASITNEGVGKAGKEEWVVCNCKYDEDKIDSSTVPPSPPPPKRAPKAVDEDLYKISPQLLHSKPTRVTHSSPNAPFFTMPFFTHFFIIPPTFYIFGFSVLVFNTFFN